MSGTRRALLALTFGLAQILFGLCVASGLVLMAVMNLGAHGPFFAEFMVEVWPLAIALVGSALAMFAAARTLLEPALLALGVGAAALTYLWWPFLR